MHSDMLGKLHELYSDVLTVMCTIHTGADVVVFNSKVYLY